MRVAKVSSDAALNRAFDYAVPEEFAALVQPGSLVRVEFGHRIIEGFVLSLGETSDYTAKPLKPILGIAEGKPLISAPLLRLARWISTYYLVPLERCLKVMFPPTVRGGVEKDGFKRLQYVRRQTDPEKQSAVKPTKRQQEILDRLGDECELVTGFCRAWGVSPGTLKKMQADGFLVIEERIERRDPLFGRKIIPAKPLPLTEQQEAALRLILTQLEHCSTTNSPAKPILLHGVTASGKTEVYLQAIAEVLKQGKGAIVLVPEISLTPQTTHRFSSRFGSIVAVLHSQLSAGERHDEWQRLRQGDARVVVGPRSALFAPIDKLGLIIVDEEHEPSYKQSESPHYHARDVAVMRAMYENCAVVLGSATPSLESWNNASCGKYLLASMTKRAIAAEMPHTVIVDMRPEISRLNGARPIFSEMLTEAIKKRLKLGEQVMLFLNRRGWAPVVSCPSCGWKDTCSNCAVGRTFHQRDNVMRCHVCGSYTEVPKVCPECGAETLSFSGIGTQRVESIARKLFPRARIARMDVDVTTRKNSHEEILQAFRNHETDILIGTQMIAKGLDFPNVTLAGILNADMGLGIPDFRAAERTFELIAQMAGRVGRGVKSGDVIVQTTIPDEPAIVHASHEDYLSFAAEELEQRRDALFPPFTHYICATFRGENQRAVAEYALLFFHAIGPSPSREYLLGTPTPAPLEKERGEWLYQLTLRGERVKPMLERLHAALAAYPPPEKIHLAIDVDAQQ